MSNTIVRLFAGARGYSRYRHFDRIVARLSYSRERIAELVLESLRAILVHACESTAAYRETMDRAGFVPSRVSAAEEIGRLPVLTKQALRADTARYLSSAVDPARRQQKSTSGSSGQPLVFYRDLDYVEMGAAGTMRNMAVAGWRPGEAVALLWGYDFDVESFLNRQKCLLSATYYLNAFRQSDENMLRWASRLRRRGIRYLYGYPSSMHKFAAFITRNSIDLPMQAVFCTAERYFPFERPVVEQAFQCKSYDLYGSSEVLNIAFECARGNMHVSSDFVCLEEREAPASGGDAPPALLATSLLNRAQPFLRYELGDYGRLLPGACECGIHMPLMEICGGKRHDFLLTPSGTIHGAAFGRPIYAVDGVSRFQVIQHTATSYTIRVEPECGHDPAAVALQVERNVEETFRRILGQEASVRYEYTDRIEPGPGGKFRFVIREQD